MFVFVPMSAGLVLLVVAPFLEQRLWLDASARIQSAYYGMLGIASYGFPFEAIKAFVVSAAKSGLREVLGKLKPEAPTLETESQHTEPDGTSS